MGELISILIGCCCLLLVTRLCIWRLQAAAAAFGPQHPRGRPGDLVCRFCGRVFKNRPSLSRHERRHEGIFEYTCKICGKGCSSKHMYNSHMASVHQQYLVSCPLCNAPFVAKSALNIHLNTCMQNLTASANTDGENVLRDSSDQNIPTTSSSLSAQQQQQQQHQDISWTDPSLSDTQHQEDNADSSNSS